VRTGRRQKRVAGDVVRIDLGDGFACYGRVTGDAGLAVYDLRTSEDVPLPDIMSLPILFHISVIDQAITDVGSSSVTLPWKHRFRTRRRVSSETRYAKTRSEFTKVETCDRPPETNASASNLRPFGVPATSSNDYAITMRA